MASYDEIRALFANDDLKNKIEVAVIVAAEEIRSEDAGTANHTNRVLWAKGAFNDPRGCASKMLMAVLAANKALATSQIIAASDEAIQANVNAAINVFADGS